MVAMCNPVSLASVLKRVLLRHRRPLQESAAIAILPLHHQEHAGRFDFKADFIVSTPFISIADANEHMLHYISICETPGSLMPGRALHSASAKTVAILNLQRQIFQLLVLNMFETFFPDGVRLTCI